MANTYKPGIPKRYLLLVTGIVWTIAGTILLTRGLVYDFQYNKYLVLKLTIATLFGICLVNNQIHRPNN